MKLEPVQPRTRAASVWTVEHAGIKILKVLYTVNIDMWKHPKYYKELRKRNKLAESRQPVVGGQQQSDQAISLRESETSAGERAPGQGLKLQASSAKLQASSAKLTKQQAASVKPRGTSIKLQAASDKLQDS